MSIKDEIHFCVVTMCEFVKIKNFYKYYAKTTHLIFDNIKGDFSWKIIRTILYFRVPIVKNSQNFSKQSEEKASNALHVY